MREAHIIPAGIVIAAVVAAFTGCLLADATPPADADAPSTAPEADAASADPVPLRVVFFYSPTCDKCRRVREGLPRIVQEFGDRIVLDSRSTKDVEVFSEMFVYEKHYSVEIDAPPVVFVGTRALVGERTILQDLRQAIVQELAGGSATFQPTPEQLRQHLGGQSAMASVLGRFRGFTTGTVMVAGLIDGVNPCAFTTIIFLLSMLKYLGRSRQQMLTVAVGFTFAVFVTYFLLGLGVMEAVKIFSVNSGVARAMAWTIGLGAIVLAGWSLVDAIRYLATGSVKSVTLGLPQAVKNRIHKVIREGMKMRVLLVGALSVGLLVAILESLCTGQVYLPTIVFVARSSGPRVHAMMYLLLYNVMFILPLVGILAVAYYGVSSESLGEFLRRHLAGFKFALAALFAALGTLVILTA